MQSHTGLNPNLTCYHCNRTAEEIQYLILNRQVLPVSLCAAHRHITALQNAEYFGTEGEALTHLVTRNLQ